jgi:hypothetical protein
MKSEILIIFLILLLVFVLYSFLGGNYNIEGFSGKFTGTFKLTNNKPISGSGASTSSATKYDNYNHYTRQSTKLSPGTTYYGPQGKTASVFTNSDGSQSLQIVLPGSSVPTTFKSVSTNKDKIESYVNYYDKQESTQFIGPNKSNASIVQNNDGQNAIKVDTLTGTYYYNMSGDNDLSSTQYYGSTGYSLEPHNTSYTTPKKQGKNISYSANNISGEYSDSLPPGIPKSQIPPGQEDLYILKSQIVPPVCPVCPSIQLPKQIPNNNQIIGGQKQETCPPCPACARCPESSFECKKVPNYNAINSDYLPTPVLADFSQFGM